MFPNALEKGIISVSPFLNFDTTLTALEIFNILQWLLSAG